VIAIVSLGFTSWLIDDNIKNFFAVRQAVREGWAKTWGPRYWVAIASLVSSLMMFVVWMGFAIIGLIAMSVGPESSDDQLRQASSFNGALLIAMTLVLAGIQVWQMYARTKIRPLIAPRPNSVDDAADQTQHAADMVNALRTGEDTSSGTGR
jgi:Na+/proline symporter